MWEIQNKVNKIDYSSYLSKFMKDEETLNNFIKGILLLQAKKDAK